MATKFLRRFEDAGFPSSAYSIHENDDPNDAFCIRQEGAHWAIFYTERGQRSPIATTLNEFEALDILDLLLQRRYGKWTPNAASEKKFGSFNEAN
jgi:hypothetical protein